MKTLCLSVFLFLSGNAIATEYFVCATTGCDCGDGSSTAPFATINAALEAANTGDVVTVKEGIYRESLTVTTDNVTIKAAPSAYVLISGCKLVNSPVEQTKINNRNAWRVKVADKVWDAFLDAEMLQWARFPDKTVEMNSINNSSGFVVHNNIVINAKEGFRYNDFRDGPGAGRDVWVYNKGVPVKIYDPKLDPNAASIDYVGAVDPKKGMFKAGSTVKPIGNDHDKKLLKTK